jgi:hypothetical protein
VAHLLEAPPAKGRLDTIYLERLGLNIALYKQLQDAKANLAPADMDALVSQHLSKKRERPVVEHQEGEQEDRREEGEDDEEVHVPTKKQTKDAFDPEAFLESLKPMIQLPPPPPLMVAASLAPIPIVVAPTGVLDAYFHTHHLNIQMQSFREPLARGGFIELALDMGHEWDYIANRLGIRGKKPSSGASAQQARLLYNLIVKLGLSRLRYLQPANGHVMSKFAGGHIMALKRHIKSNMSDDERAWWQDESPRMLQTTTLIGEPLSYVDPTWLLPE